MSLLLAFKLTANTRCMTVIVVQVKAVQALRRGSSFLPDFVESLICSILTFDRAI